MFTVYILQSQNTGYYYIGQTNNFEERLLRHNSNRSKSTKNKGIWKVIRKEFFSNRTDAVKRERQIKSYKGGNEFKKLIGLVRPATAG
jgi:putative endonuclease